MVSKKKTVDKHFAARCIQRLGYVPDSKELVKQIQDGKLEFHYRESNRITHWKWLDPIKGINCILIYDKDRKQIVTVLFEDTKMYLDNQRELYSSKENEE